MQEIEELKPQLDDLVVVPEGTVLPENPPFMVHRMKFLHQPSIVRSRGHNMAFFEKFSFTNLSDFLGLASRTSVREEIFNTKEYGEKLRGDSTETFVPVTPSEVQGLAQGTWIEPGVLADGTPVAETKPTEVISYSGSLPRIWRYVRIMEPVPHAKKFGTGENFMRVSAKGGVAFYIELDAANKTFAFSYALCHTSENFNSLIARHISKQRFECDDWYEVKNYDGSKGLVENIAIALFNELYNGECDREKEIVFSSMSDRMKVYELEQVYDRIKQVIK